MVPRSQTGELLDAVGPPHVPEVINVFVVPGTGQPFLSKIIGLLPAT